MNQILHDFIKLFMGLDILYQDFRRTVNKVIEKQQKKNLDLQALKRAIAELKQPSYVVQKVKKPILSEGAIIINPQDLIIINPNQETVDCGQKVLVPS